VLAELASLDLITDDGEPMESTWHRKCMTLLIEQIEYHLRDRDDFYVGGNAFISYSPAPARKRESGRRPCSDPDPYRAPIHRRGRRFPGQGRQKTIRGASMSRVCQVSGKRVQTGNNVSHANNKTRRRFLPNLHERRFWVASENRWVKLKVSAHALRTIDKNGIDSVLAQLRARGEKV